jgi:hypothetical protein
VTTSGVTLVSHILGETQNPPTVSITFFSPSTPQRRWSSSLRSASSTSWDGQTDTIQTDLLSYKDRRSLRSKVKGSNSKKSNNFRKKIKKKTEKRKGKKRNLQSKVQHAFISCARLSFQLHSQSIIVWTPWSDPVFSSALKLLLFTLAKLSTDFALLPWSTHLSLIFSHQTPFQKSTLHSSLNLILRIMDNTPSLHGSMKHTQMANGHCAIAETSSFGGMASTPCLHWSMEHTLIKNPNCTIPAIAFMGGLHGSMDHTLLGSPHCQNLTS